MARRRKLIAGNWKMNGLKAQMREARTLAARLKRASPRPKCDFLICPPATLLAPLAAGLRSSRIRLGGQDCHVNEAGAHTGDISAEMLKDAGASFVIAGHSERRADHGEASGLVAAKVAAAHRAGLTAIICIGETLKQRKAGRAGAVVSAQLKASLPAGAVAKNTVIAYEPVWAIGTGVSAGLDDIEKMHGSIRKTLAKLLGAGEADSMRVLYGGSVKPGNAGDILKLDNVDGALVGGASLKASDFWAIGKAVA